MEYLKWEMENKHCISDKELSVEKLFRNLGDEGLFFGFVCSLLGFFLMISRRYV